MICTINSDQITINNGVHLLFEIAGGQKKLLGVYETKTKAEYYKEVAEEINKKNVVNLMCDESYFVTEEHPIL